MNEELDSQLSAMFDDELPQQECELLARRLSRDGDLKARWGRYAVMGAAIRAERGVRLNAAVAGRVSAVLLAEPEFGTPVSAVAHPRSVRWWQPVAGVAVAAGVATLSILWLRAQAPLGEGAPLTADTQAAPSGQLTVVSTQSASSDSYVTPTAPARRAVVVPGTELANYVVAHSMYSPPVARRNLLSAFMTGEAPPAGTEDLQGDAKSDPKAHAQ